MDIEKIPSVPDSCKQEVPVAKVAELQEQIDWETKKGDKRTRDRFAVRLSADGKTANMTDLEHADYKARKEAVEKIKKDRKKAVTARVQKRIDSAIEKGKKIGVKEYRTSDKFAKVKEIAYKKGLRDGKPKASIESRLAKSKERRAQEDAKIAELEKKANPETPETKE